ncbi:hypothetical protein BHE74_00039027 [Ensete ventricosum]|uniref:Uncharacterized protein n=1 Tax=Ensete ventricosum TaxID=4639 RepID=A0A444DKL6_ENSVE|nr:hypothetical protein B296_00037763 [Ensete ventricosum]RWV98667.1 hypothetical protein GW17_00038471 [Ensete ventricosum]RWW54406.1 hypothetical protein BHE74_00039027 [Ensete ventricosum]RZS14607.1 hypothetical protein BHM03_00046326 [Ensete ventricosum]
MPEGRDAFKVRFLRISALLTRRGTGSISGAKEEGKHISDTSVNMQRSPAVAFPIEHACLTKHHTVHDCVGIEREDGSVGIGGKGVNKEKGKGRWGIEA